MQRVPGMFDYLKWRLEKYPYVGISEFHLNQVPKDKMLFKKITAERSNWISISIFIPEKRRFLFASSQNNLGGYVDSRRCRNYDTRLYADTSHRELDILNEDGTDPDNDFREDLWLAPIWVNSQWDDYSHLIETGNG